MKKVFTALGHDSTAGHRRRPQWDIIFPDGDLCKGGVGGQGIYGSPSVDAVVVWFSTGHQLEELVARAIASRLEQSSGR